MDCSVMERPKHACSQQALSFGVLFCNVISTTAMMITAEAASVRGVTCSPWNC